MGGLISLYGFLRTPGVFGFCGVMSPSLWFANRAIFEYAAGVDRWFGRVYLDIGAEEGQRHVRDTRAMYRLLRRKCPHPHDQIICIVEEGAQQTEQAWAQRFDMAVRFLLPKKKQDVLQPSGTTGAGNLIISPEECLRAAEELLGDEPPRQPNCPQG